MALDIEVTLGEARASVLARCNMAAQGNQSAAFYPIADEFIRSAQREIYKQGEWPGLNKIAYIPLIPEQAVYDWPDDAPIGRITSVFVETDEGDMYQLDPGLRVNERRTSNDIDNEGGGDPLLYRYESRELHIAPSPSDKYVQMGIEYIQGLTTLVEDEDRLTVDSEAVIRLATVFLRRHFGMPGANELMASYQQYLMDLLAEQSDGEGFQWGGRQSRIVKDAATKINRIADYKGNSNFYDTNWKPW